MDVISAVIPPKPLLKQVRFGANPRPPDKAKVDGRPGWLTNFESDICFICFLAGHRSPNCQNQVRDLEFEKWVLANFNRLAEEQRSYLSSIGRVPVEVLLEEARREISGSVSRGDWFNPSHTAFARVRSRVFRFVKILYAQNPEFEKPP